MRLLIATVTAGAGHLQAAAALEEAWRSLHPDEPVQRLDVLAFTPKLYRKAYALGYIKLVAHAPELWGLVFDRTDNPNLVRKLTRLRRGLAKRVAPKFARQVCRFEPQAVVCTHFMPLEVLGQLKTQAQAQHKPWPVMVCVVTDFQAHALWLEPCVDLYCVAAEQTKARLVARGVPATQVVVTGIPVAPQFAARPDRSQARRRLGLRDDLPVLLVLGGGFGVGPMCAVLTEINKLDRLVQLVVACGRNEPLRRELALADWRQPTRVLGFVNNMHELMAAADLVLTKPGGLTTAEALAVGRPLLIIQPIPGQELANSDFLLEHGAAVKAERVDDLPYRLEQVLEPTRLARLRRAARALGRPQAAVEICQRIVQLAAA
jgi:processive 1,2-diacylglycerol beta-glucosyltransferase